jgi:hypothetical protein
MTDIITSQWTEIEEEPKAKLGKFGKDPTVETGFLPDRYGYFIYHSLKRLALPSLRGIILSSWFS